MATSFIIEGVTVATRFWGGRERGMVVQMEITEREFDETFSDMFGSEDECGPMVRASDWVADQIEACNQFHWDNPARQNMIARQMREHRFAGEVPQIEGAAIFAEQRARVIRRDVFSVVR